MQQRKNSSEARLWNNIAYENSQQDLNCSGRSSSTFPFVPTNLELDSAAIQSESLGLEKNFSEEDFLGEKPSRFGRGRFRVLQGLQGKIGTPRTPGVVTSPSSYSRCCCFPPTSRSECQSWLRSCLGIGWVCDPRVGWIRHWVLLGGILLLFTSFVTPFEVSFLSVRVDTLFFINRVVDFMFIVDIFINFHMAYFDRQTGQWIYNSKQIAQHYLMGWFLIDLMGSLPYDAANSLHNDGVGLMSALRFMKLLKLLRLLRAGRIFTRFEATYKINYNTVQLSQFLLYSLLGVHWMACVFGLLQKHEGEQTWLTLYNDKGRQLDLDDYVATTPFQIYVMALYWSSMTMSTIGYGDIVPVNTTERVLNIVCQMWGALFYGYIIGAVSGVIAMRDQNHIRFATMMTKLNSFIGNGVGIPLDLQQRLREYFRYHLSKDSTIYEDVLNTMSPALRAESALTLNRYWIYTISFLKDCPDQLISQLVLVMHSCTYPPYEHIISKGSQMSCMYVVKSGVVLAKSRVFGRGKVFGDECLTNFSKLAAYTAVSITYTELSSLSREDAFMVFEDFPHVIKAIHTHIIRNVFRHEVLAYAEAFRQVQNEMRDSSKNKRYNLRRMSQQALDVLADSSRQERITFYKKKLKCFLVVKNAYNAFAIARAASLIQRIWRNHQKVKHQGKTSKLDSLTTDEKLVKLITLVSDVKAKLEYQTTRLDVLSGIVAPKGNEPPTPGGAHSSIGHQSLPAKVRRKSSILSRKGAIGAEDSEILSSPSNPTPQYVEEPIQLVDPIIKRGARFERTKTRIFELA